MIPANELITRVRIANVKTILSNVFSPVSTTTIISSASSTFMFFNGSGSGIIGYKDLISLPNYSAGSLGSTAQTVTTSETLLDEFATLVGSPGLTVIPIGTISFHYDIQKTSGGQNYYSYAKLYKRDLSGIETLLLTSDVSSSSSSNTRLQTDVSAITTSAITLLATDLLVVKVYAVMLLASATITLYYDNTTSARLVIPVNVSEDSGLIIGSYSTVLNFNVDQDIYHDATGETITFTLGSNNVNGKGIILRLNKPTAINFPATFEADSASTTLDSTKLNVYLLIFFTNWNGSGLDHVIYKNSTFIAQ